jgi:hypothetical protein
MAKRSRSAIGRQNRARGGAYERWVAAKFKPVFPGARRGIGQARSGGDVPDVEHCGPYWVQCKSEKSPNLITALKQSQDEMFTRRLQSHSPSPYTVPIAVGRRTGRGEDDVVALKLDAFIALLTENKELRRQFNSAESATIELSTLLDKARSGAYPSRPEQYDKVVEEAFDKEASK